jgi:septal ring factor EnvC (AmiA/AmiB activator)
MSRNRVPIGLLSAGVVGFLLVLGVMVHQSLGVNKWRASFNDEMAQRLDLEEKIAQMEKARSALMADAKELTARLGRAQGEIENLKSALVRERDDKKAIQARLDQMQASLTTSTTK